jgi:hypothetical protein
MFGSSRGDITHDEAFRLMLAAAGASNENGMGAW